MKYSTIYKSLFYFGIVFGTMGCTGNFDRINTNPLLPKSQDLLKDGVLNGTFIPTLEFAPIPVGLSGTGFVNNYQVTINLTTDSWMGYMAPRDAKWVGRNLSQFYFDDGWTNGTFSNGIVDIFTPWMQIKKITMDGPAKNKEIFSIAQISKIMGLHRAADKWGSIPYFNVGNGAFKVKYDSGEDIYKSFFKELEEAVDILYTYSQTNANITRSSDVIYDGNALKWAKLGNSLMLRLAMRVRYADEALSKTWAEKAINHPAGLIQHVDEVAKIQDGAGLRTKNALYTIAGAYNDTRMGASIQSYMAGYSDPRLNVYFEGNTSIAVPPAIPATGASYDRAAKPRVNEFSATYWFKASEVKFLLAEAALYGYDTKGKKAKELYEEGIKLSFEENGITTGLAGYIANQEPPLAFVDNINPGYSAAKPSTISVAWNEGASQEVKLEKIIVQKYLAIFPDSMEAWSEWRRTGYPRLIPPFTNISNRGVVKSDGHKDGVRSWPYPMSELNENTENVTEAINTYRAGANVASVNVWWDKKVK